jgi:hypothetical protein
MHEFLTQWLPALVPAITVSASTRRAVNRKLTKHIIQMNNVFRYASQQAPAKVPPGE